MNSMFALGEASIALIWMVIMVLFYGFVCMVGIAGYVLSSWGMYSISKRRGISKPWLAWLPIGSEWILGSVSDQYQHLIQGKVTSRRKILLILNLASFVLGIAYMVMTVVAEVLMGESIVGGVLLAMGIPYLLTLGVSITLMVFYHICNYDFYRSCKPDSAVVFLVLGIFLPICMPFFYFACRKKDLGFVIPQTAASEPAELPQANPEF